MLNTSTGRTVGAGGGGRVDSSRMNGVLRSRSDFLLPARDEIFFGPEPAISMHGRPITFMHAPSIYTYKRALSPI